MVRDYLDCDYETGQLTWRVRPNNRRFTTRYAGTEAFTAVESNGYRRGSINNQLFRRHQVVWCHYHGKWPTDPIDHKRGVVAGDGIENLEQKPHKLNCRNQKLRSTNKTGVMGVTPYGDRFRVNISVDGKNIHIGIYDTKKEATAARKQAELDYGFSKHHGRL